jgi:hypothetical protein
MVIFINANLLPNKYIKKKNLLISAVILDSNQPKNFNLFLKPIINELKVKF